MRAVLSRMSVPVLLLAAGVWLQPRPADAQTVTIVGPDRVTIRAQNVPIAVLLTELASLGVMERIEIDPRDQNRTVTLTAEDVPVRVAMLLALRTSGVDFLFTEKRLRVGAGGKVIETPRQQPVLAVERDRDVPVRATRPVAAPPIGQPIDDNRDGIHAADARADGAASGSASTGSADAQQTSASNSAVSEFDHGLSVRDVPYVVKEDSVVVTEPGFVPYKNRPEVKRLRLATDAASIP